MNTVRPPSPDAADLPATVDPAPQQQPTSDLAAPLATLARLKPAAAVLMSMGVLLLLAGWLMPQLWRPSFASQRPLGFVLVGAGALLMWLHVRRQADRIGREALSTLTHSTLMPYEFAPVTLPMEDPADVGNDAPAANAAVDTRVGPMTSPPTPADVPIESTTPSVPVRWSLGLLRALEWRRFEALCEEVFKQDGYVVRREPGHSDRGGFLWLHSRLDLEQAVRIVRCRAWSGEPVEVAAVREFLGAMVDAGLKSGALMTCGAFAADAETLARRHGIMLISGPDLMALVAKRSEALQRELLDVATQGEYRRPTCPRCGQKMLARPDTDTAGPTHWVCNNHPRCPGTLDWSPGPP